MDQRDALLQRLEELQAELREVTEELVSLETPEERRRWFRVIQGGAVAAAAMWLGRRLRPPVAVATVATAAVGLGFLVQGGPPTGAPPFEDQGPVAPLVDPSPSPSVLRNLDSSAPDPSSGPETLIPPPSPTASPEALLPALPLPVVPVPAVPTLAPDLGLEEVLEGTKDRKSVV